MASKYVRRHEIERSHGRLEHSFKMGISLVTEDAGAHSSINDQVLRNDLFEWKATVRGDSLMAAVKQVKAS